MTDWLDDLSIWIEANRDCTPDGWVNEVWPRIKFLILQHEQQAILSELKNVLIAYNVYEEYRQLPRPQARQQDITRPHSHPTRSKA